MRRLDRRRFLKGAGSVLIGLPFLGRRAIAAPGRAPSRYLSLYFGNGLPKKFADEGFSTVLSPLAPFADKIAMVRGIHLNETGGADLHYKGTARFAKGFSPISQSSPGGESLDNLAHRTYAPGSLLLNLSMHAHVTNGNPLTRWTHSWRGPMQPNDSLDRPLALFDRVFGTMVPVGNLTEEEKLAIRRRNSVLDAVTEQYRVLSGPTSPYGAVDKAKLSDHLDLIRSLERQAIAVVDDEACRMAAAPPDLIPSQQCNPTLCPGDNAYYYGTGGANWNEVWTLNAEIYALALRCGITRFGTIGMSGGGDRYPIPELMSQGVGSSPHALAHLWTPNQENGFDKCVHWLMQKIAFFIGALDAPEWVDENGATILDDTLVLLGTELGTPAGGQHSVESLTFMLIGGSGRIESGIHDASGHTDVDLYSTISRAMGLGEVFGDPTELTGHLDLVR